MTTAKAKDVMLSGNVVYNPTNDDWESWPVDSNGIPKVNAIGKISQQVGGLDVSASNPVPATLSTSLSKDLDSVDVGKMSHSGVVTALNAVTATTTSDEISVGASGFKHIKLELTGAAFTSGNFAVTISGCDISGGTFTTINKQKDDATFTPIVVPTISTNATFIYVIPFVSCNYIKVTGTRTTDGTLTAKVTAFN